MGKLEFRASRYVSSMAAGTSSAAAFSASESEAESFPVVSELDEEVELVLEFDVLCLSLDGALASESPAAFEASSAATLEPALEVVSSSSATAKSLPRLG
eukprot:220859-Amphidinium_carterae.1